MLECSVQAILRLQLKENIEIKVARLHLKTPFFSEQLLANDEPTAFAEILWSSVSLPGSDSEWLFTTSNMTPRWTC